MAHFAKVKNGIVTNVIVADQDFVDSYIDHEAGRWIQTSYNTIGSVHTESGTPLRKNFASIGGVYDAERDAFYLQKPYPSWTLDEDTCFWNPPVARPNDEKRYTWNETDKQWDEIT
tara:strand:- start:15 stop:362 length:348 start_codon:yes stop_codon:yes gene_type:complete